MKKSTSIIVCILVIVVSILTILLSFYLSNNAKKENEPNSNIEESKRFTKVEVYKKDTASNYVLIEISEEDKKDLLEQFNNLEIENDSLDTDSNQPYKIQTDNGTFYYDGNDSIFYVGDKKAKINNENIVSIFKKITSNQPSNNNSNIISNSNSNKPIKESNSNISNSNISNINSNTTRRPGGSGDCCSCCPNAKPGEACIDMCCSCNYTE